MADAGVGVVVLVLIGKFRCEIARVRKLPIDVGLEWRMHGAVAEILSDYCWDRR